jgi:hypothetical protein
VTGKGRKQRATPLTRETTTVIRKWLSERQGQPQDPLFPTHQGTPLSRHAIGLLLRKHTATATTGCRSLSEETVTPHVLRHTNAMLLRASGVDIATIALRLGHESIKTTPAQFDFTLASLTLGGSAAGLRSPPQDRLGFSMSRPLPCAMHHGTSSSWSSTVSRAAPQHQHPRRSRCASKPAAPSRHPHSLST